MYICRMIFADTHTHIYLKEFDEDREQIIKQAFEKGVHYLFLPNIDKDTQAQLDRLSSDFPDRIFPLCGLHPTHVKEDFQSQLEYLKSKLDTNIYYGVGECGIDLYWDKTFLNEQKVALHTQAGWALEKNLPLIIHSRDSFDEIFDVLKDFEGSGLKGIFHCFSGGIKELEQIRKMGFLFGIGGVVTFKKSNLPEMVREMRLEEIVFETDAPYLAPMPYRGKRNEPSYIPLIAEKVALLHELSLEEVARVSTQNALELFNLGKHD